jgi:endonuclease/exonuclease/phosphatase (EEP) superfamily protein YafD
MDTIIQWNVRGLNANREELHLLLRHSPIAVCLQETLLLPEKDASIPGYTCLKRHTNRGSALCIRSDFLFNEIILDTPLEAIAARISNKKTLTLCSLYLSPSKVVTKTDLENLFTQLPIPFLVVGDFNGHSPRWGSSGSNIQGKIIEDVIDALDLSLLNSGEGTFLAQSGEKTHLDLAICHPSLFLDLEWSVHSDLCGSDHFPTFVKFSEKQSEEPSRIGNFLRLTGTFFVF